ncbi:hypothetical protein F2P81_011739 [Scophthalmus maximus]|uniref:Uncharacterized protein n=1 Tax=Scophthalmus maximus TaxID=52904 RepID=A0A6A4SSK3_SCOMX|nr:hypothetical protein F2P81_011739 [Scophthalmus maximus]
MENSDLWYNCRFDNFTGTWLCASSKETEWIQAVQVLMVLSVVFSSVSFLVFLGQLFTMSKGGLFYFTGLCQVFAGLMAFSAALIYTLHNKEILPSSKELTSGHFGYCFILAWIYYASEEYGLDSTVTCDGYFFMADVFAKQGKMSITRSLYSAVAHTWHCHLTELLHTHVQFFQNPDELLEPSYDKGRRAEGDEMLRTMLEFEQDNSRKEPAQIALVAHCLAMLWFLEGDNLKALGFGGTALQASQLIPNRDLTEAIRGLLQLVQSLQTGPPPGSG